MPHTSEYFKRAASPELIATIARSIGQGIVVTDQRSPKATVVYVNPAMCRLLGREAHEIIGRSMGDFTAEQTSAEALARVTDARASKRPLKMDVIQRRKDGTTFIDGVEAIPLLDENGELANYLSLHSDVTESRQREKVLHEAQRMETIGQLTGGIAHDFNNILAVIRTNAEDLCAQLQEHGESTESAAMVLQATLRGAELVQRLLAFSRKQDLHPTQLDLNGAIGGAVKLAKRTMPENIEIATSLAATTPHANVDAGLLENALLNLMINARDAMPSGGRINIKTDVVVRDSAYAHANPHVAPGEYAAISISDTGTGMSPEVLARAFEPFFTTKPVGVGTGLGLSMVYGFVHQSGGHAHIESELGAGTTVSIFLPRVAQSAAEALAPVPQVKAAAQAAASGKLLLVEDDELVRASVRSKLKRLGYTVSCATNAAEALKLLEGGEGFDLVLSDVVMPGTLSGADLARQIKERWPMVKVLLSSGYTASAIMGRIEIPDGVPLLSKPYSNDELRAAIAKARGIAA